MFDPPAEFLNQLFASVVAQTYENWEACVVDGGSRDREMLEALQRWIKADARIRVQRLEENLGISENTNHALRVATGDFVALVDHDDALAPFALYELASAIRRRPAADIFYSDEDRLCESGNGRGHVHGKAPTGTCGGWKLCKWPSFLEGIPHSKKYNHQLKRFEDEFVNWDWFQ